MTQKRTNNRQQKGGVKQKQLLNESVKESNKKTDFPTLLGLSIIILLGIIIYSNSFDCTFHLDDVPNIVENTKIQDLFDVKTLWNTNQTRFVSFYSFAVNYHFGKLDVWGYHLVNLIIHLINACLIYWLTLLIFSSPALKEHAISNDKKILAFFTALLFVSHPLATQSVTYIVQRMASLVALFYLLSMAFYVKARLTDKNNSSKYFFFGGALISAVLAMLTKENSFTLPFAIVLFEIIFLQRKKFSINFKNNRVILLTLVFIGFILILVLRFSGSIFRTLPPDDVNNFTTITPINYLFTQFSVIVKYIQLLFVPVNQNLDYDMAISNSFFEIRTIISFLFLSSLFVLAIFRFKKIRLISFGIFWFFLTLSIESSIIPIDDLIFEHRTYLPSYGFFLIFSSGIYLLLWKKYKNIAMAILIIIIVSNSFLTYERNKIWKNDLSLWDDVVAKSPNKARGIVTRGITYRKSNQNEKALADYNRAIEISPQYYKAYYNRALAYSEEDRDKALDDFNKTIEINPKYAFAYNNRGDIYSKLKQWNKAADDFSKAIELNPKYVNAYSNLGNVYVSLKQYDKAINLTTKAIELNPNSANSYNSRGVAYVYLKRWDKALFDFTKALEIDPSMTIAQSNRDYVKKKLESKIK